MKINRLPFIKYFLTLTLSLLIISPLAFAARKSAFNGLNSSGHVIIYIRPAKRVNTFYMTRKNKKRINTKVRNRVLYVKGPIGTRKPAIITVRAKNLRRIETYESSSVRGKKIRANNLTVITHDNSKVNLSGMINLKYVTALNSSHINLRWVNSKKVKLYSIGNSKIRLSGRVKTLHARLFGNSKLNAKFLRANHVWVQTNNHASAKLLPIISIRAFAADDSNIYYYKYPKYITRHTTQSGNVLQLGWHN